MQSWPLRITRLLDHAACEHGDRPIVSRYADGQIDRTSWRDIEQDARKLANALVRLQICAEDRVATLAMNHARHLVAWYGTIGMGGILHTVNPRLFDDQIVYILNHAADRVLLFDEQFRNLVDRLRPRLTSIEHFISFSPDCPHGFDVLLAPEMPDFAWREVGENAPAMLCYTSGTTGDPKGVLYNHRTTVLHAMSAALPDLFDLRSQSVVLPIVPMFHAAAWGLPFAAALTGAQLVFSAVNEPETIDALIHAEEVTHSAGVPTVWLALAAHVSATGGDYGRLHSLTIGGAAAPRSLIEHFDAKGIRVCHAWGMTEMSPIGTFSAPVPDDDGEDREACIDTMTRQGRPPFGIELRIVDDAGRSLPRDGQTSGKLQARGAWVIERYFLDTDAKAVDDEGWFDTGDVAILHLDGSMQITDRAKDVIKSGGEWISSVELENAAVGCDGVAEAAAIAVPHPKWDERPVLIVVRSEESAVSPAEIIDHLSAHVAKWWLPDEILFVDALPHTATGKILKADLRKQYAQRLTTAHASATGKEKI